MQPAQSKDAFLQQLSARFGHDFANVRIHADEHSAAAARAMGARAFTVGNDIGFGAREYRPDQAAGRALIAHELAHVVQQSRGGAAHDAESRAECAAAVVLGGRQVSPAALGGAPVGVQRKHDPPGTTPDETPDIITGAAAGADGAAAIAPTAAAPPDRTLLSGFAADRASLTPSHQLLIEAVAFQVWSNLEREPGATVSIAITGHTDTTGTEKYNSGLATTRAANARAALEAALTRQGLDAAKIEAVTASSRGESQLLVPTADEVAEPQNRRVEIEVTLKLREKPQPPPRTISPLPGTPGGPKIWEVPGLMDDLDQPDVYGPRLPPAPPSREWLEEALKRDPLLKKLPKWARERAIGTLKDGDEKAADAIIDAIPFGDSEAKQAAKAAMKALLQTLKSRKFKPPPPPPPRMPDDLLKPPSFPKAPGEKIFKLPAIRF